MSEVLELILPHYDLMVLRTLVLRQHVERLRPLEREVVRRLHGIACARQSPGRIAERLDLSTCEVWRLHENAVQELGLAALLEAAA